MKKSNWTVAYASVMGNLHVKENIPCQDSCDYHSIDENWGIAVVADGAGSCEYSHLGSQIATKAATKYFASLIKREKWMVSGKVPEPAEWQRLAIETLEKVKDEIEQEAEKKELKATQLSCTLIVVIHTPDLLLATNIGDGRAGYSNGKDWKALIVPYSGVEANETIFITSQIWDAEHVNRFIRSYIIKDKIEAFVLMTDGCEKGSFEVNLYNEEKEKYYDPNRPYPKFFDPNVKGLKMLRKDGKTQEDINNLWSGFLEKGTKQFQTEMDDKTMILGVLTKDKSG